jgi:hypothetical protein
LPCRSRARSNTTSSAFDEFFFDRAKDVYPRYDFARNTDDECGEVVALD